MVISVSAVIQAQTVIGLWIKTALEKRNRIYLVVKWLREEAVKISVSKAEQKATEKYAKENYDRIQVEIADYLGMQIVLKGESEYVIEKED